MWSAATKYLLLWVSTAIAVSASSDATTPARPGRRCGSEISSDKFRLFEADGQNANSKNSQSSPTLDQFPQVSIDVYWNVVAANQTYEGGWISREDLAIQMNVLNQDYKAFGLSFNAKLVTRIINPTWFNQIVHSTDTTMQDALKQKYRKGDVKTLNIYTVGFLNDHTLGYSTFPFEYSDAPHNDGVMIRWDTTPGGVPPFHLGKTVTHEVGHWLGLYHTFQGNDCNGAGDGVDDTPPERNATSGCPAQKDTCSGGGVDPIHNYMDYSDDDCLNQFTNGQMLRARTYTAYYRQIGVPAGFTTS
ncbi:metalloprotease [Pluteus cervinus]|uniref:Metalloprotease n=1 Tax=Pluteus cervinus TaxID=181527 RepID=A0ACD3B7I2_9AGAR|nr:metalloprotease [Pluteus cervinus]